MHKKIVLFIFCFAFLINLKAAETALDIVSSVEQTNKEDNKWKVTSSKGDVCYYKESPSETTIRVNSDWDISFGFTYENTCTSVETRTLTSVSTAFKSSPNFVCDSLSGDIGYLYDNENISTISSNNDEFNSIKLFNNITKKYYDVDKIVAVTGTAGTSKFAIDGGGTRGDGGGYTGNISSGGTSNVACGGFIDYYANVRTFKTRKCIHHATCSSCRLWVSNGCVSMDTYDCPEEYRINGDWAYPNGELNDGNATSPGDYAIFAPEPPACNAGDEDAGVEPTVIAVEPWRRAVVTTSVRVCTKVEPTKVETFTNKFTIYGGSGKGLLAYCINPALDFNSDFKWDNTFKSSKCHDSLHSYDENGNLVFDMECGFVYILTEANRLNSEYCYNTTGNYECNKELFSYSTITTAMRLFGTGITTKDTSLPDIGDLTSHLTSAGYYTNYYGWGYAEFTGIPYVIPEKPSDWPGIYRDFMPEFYSIYLHSAEVAEKYLRDENGHRIRFSDVGNIECDLNSGNNNCIRGEDPKKGYLSNADEYLQYIDCETTYSNCTSTSASVSTDYATSEGQSRYENFPHSETRLSGSTTVVQDFLTTDIGQRNSCSGMGVMCGKKGEKLSNGGNVIGTDPDYLDAVYLYIRALQGNNILYEHYVEENAKNYHVPIEGLTKLIYDNGKYYLKLAVEPPEVKTETKTIDCDTRDANNPINPEYCKARIKAYDANGNLLLDNDNYSYCIKNFCYVELVREATCDVTTNTGSMSLIVLTDLDLKANLVKKINNGIATEQTLYVYDKDAKLNGAYCQHLNADTEKVTYNCRCDDEQNSNNPEPNGNINDVNYCTDNYNTFDELYYGDPSMSTIINACYKEDKNKYDYTKELNVNANDYVRDGEQEVAKYGYQMKSDEFDFCTLYCRDEARAYLANRTAVRAGMHLKYDIGSLLLNKKIVNETGSKILSSDEFNNNKRLKFVYGSYEDYVASKNDNYRNYNDLKDDSSYFTLDEDSSKFNFSPIVILQFKECTSLFDYDKWKTYYNSADARAKKQLIYGAYNCNLYSSADLPSGLLSDKYNDGKSLKSYKNNSNEVGFPEPAMIEYKYDTKTGETSVIKNWGTTKDYLLAEEQKACESIGLKKGDCGIYNVLQYEEDFYGKNTGKTYIESLGSDSLIIDSDMGLVDSNLNNTIYCNDDSCYKIKGKDGKYYYNPYAKDANTNKEYTVVTEYTKDGIIYRASGNILSYSDWATKYKDYTIDSSHYKTASYGGYNIPINKYSSFIVVTEFDFYNKQTYFADAFSGLVSLNSNGDGKSVKLDKNIYPLHLEIDPGTYSFESKITKFRPTYYKSKYYDEQNYSLLDERKYLKGIDPSTASAPYTFKYICYYDVDSPVKCESGKCEGKLGYVFRSVDLNDVFNSVTYEDPDNYTRNYPENWNNEFALSQILPGIEASSESILEPEGSSNYDSYLEYSYTLTKEGIKKIKEYNDSVEKNGGYLNDTVYDCEYDSDEEIFYNCKSEFIETTIGEQFTSAFSGNSLVINNKTDNPNSIIQINGVSEFCHNPSNKNTDYCKYQRKD